MGGSHVEARQKRSGGPWNTMFGNWDFRPDY